ncbi:TPA: ead/Ea22-like family protein [Escherichia coli]|nr:ead/Ea22-like family protein [Escherichia coli]
MSKINYRALREIAKQATQGEWVAFISPGTGTYAVHTPGDKRCEDVIKWTGFDGLKNAMAVTLEHVSVTDAGQAGVAAMIINDALHHSETPATDAFLAEIRAEARNEGINYTASRLAAAFNHGFINKSLREVFDVTRMILSAKEELANEAHPIDGLSGEYAEKSLEEWAEQIRKGSSQ